MQNLGKGSHVAIGKGRRVEGRKTQDGKIRRQIGLLGIRRFRPSIIQRLHKCTRASGIIAAPIAKVIVLSSFASKSELRTSFRQSQPLFLEISPISTMSVNYPTFRPFSQLLSHRSAPTGLPTHATLRYKSYAWRTFALRHP